MTRRYDPMTEAAQWLVELITATDLELLWPAFEKWLQQSAEHRSAYQKVQGEWSLYDCPHETLTDRKSPFPANRICH